MSIAAASIIAKTTREALMRNLGREYPQYDFADHVGYATAFHRRTLAAAGPCPQPIGARSGWRRTLSETGRRAREKVAKTFKE